VMKKFYVSAIDGSKKSPSASIFFPIFFIHINQGFGASAAGAGRLF